MVRHDTGGDLITSPMVGTSQERVHPCLERKLLNSLYLPYVMVKMWLINIALPGLQNRMRTSRWLACRQEVDCLNITSPHSCHHFGKINTKLLCLLCLRAFPEQQEPGNAIPGIVSDKLSLTMPKLAKHQLNPPCCSHMRRLSSTFPSFLLYLCHPKCSCFPECLQSELLVVRKDG